MIKKFLSGSESKTENSKKKHTLDKKKKSKVEDSKETSGTHTYRDDFTRLIDDEDTLVLENKKRHDYPASLIMLSGPKDLIGMSWTLEKPVTGLGRSNRLNNISIPYKSLSKSHFQIIREEDKFYIVDLKSTNKTYLNDKRIEAYKKIPLENNSYIKASSLVFKFLDKGNIEAFSSHHILSRSQADSLTGIGNRELLKIKASEYFFMKQALSFIVFDIDDFKSINDNFGHLAGDYVLQSLSKCVLKLIRAGDIFVRYGGDEFCLLTLSPFSSAFTFINRIREEIMAYDFSFKSQKIHVDISMGVAEQLETDESWKDIYDRADKMSYDRKKKKKSN
ncbi:MAG: GGDEF domain-containing protein [Bdellovibrionaceae bacterium]|nr:GGDEF domain-containing protein [Pseudobdellovibrionaceae bacterium]